MPLSPDDSLLEPVLHELSRGKDELAVLENEQRSLLVAYEAALAARKLEFMRKNLQP